MQTKKTFIIPNNSRMMDMSEFVSEQKGKRDGEVKSHYSAKVDHIITFGSCTFKWCYHADALSIAESLAKVTDKPAKKK